MAEEVQAVDEAGADWVHVDVMDGHFVPNLTMGPAVVAAVCRVTSLPLDVHLMTEEPGRYLEAFADAGANLLTVHQEVCPHLHRTLESVRELGVRAGVAINPATPVETLQEAAAHADLLLVMSVNPGFGGQSFIASSTAKVARLRALLERLRVGGVELEVDGGVDPTNAGHLTAAGASVLVAGSAIFSHPAGVAAAIQALRKSAGAGAAGARMA